LVILIAMWGSVMVVFCLALLYWFGRSWPRGLPRKWGKPLPSFFLKLGLGLLRLGLWPTIIMWMQPASTNKVRKTPNQTMGALYQGRGFSCAMVTALLLLWCCRG